MARNDPVFARVDISLMWNPQFRKLSAVQKWFYLVCYLSAVEARSEQLPPAFDLAAIRDRAGIDTKTARKCLEKSLDVGLLGMTPDGLICVSGVRENHQKLVWNESTPPAPYHPHMGRMRGEEKSREPRGDGIASEEPPPPAPDPGKNNLILHRPEQAVKVPLEGYIDFCRADVTSIACTITGEYTGPGIGFFSKQLKTLAGRIGDAEACDIFREMLFRYWSELKSGELMDNIGAGLSNRVKLLVGVAGGAGKI